MASASSARTLPRFATRQVLLALVVVLFAMIALALLAAALSGGDGGTVYLAEIQPAARSGGVPSLVAVGYGKASALAETATLQLLFSNFDGYYGGGPGLVPTPGATPGSAEREAAAPIVAALIAAGIPEDAIRIVTSAAFSSSYYGPPSAQIFRIDLELANPDLEVLTGAIDAAAMAARQGGHHLSQAGAAYGVADCRPLRARAWEDAVADARARAEDQAAQLDVALGDLLVSQETAGDAAALLSEGTGSGGCTPVEAPPNLYSPNLVTITVPAFDPTAEPVVTTYAEVALAFEIVRD